MTDRARFGVTAGVAVLLAAGWMIACAFAAGASLEFWFAGMIAITALVPPLALQVRPGIVREGLVAACVIDTIGLAWLVAAVGSDTTIAQWFLAYLLLLSFALALWGIAAMLARWIDAVVASAITVALGLLWLTCPIWLTHTSATRYISLHPLFALNAILKNLGIWTEHGLAYRVLTNLGQDVPYALPNPWVVMATHAILGGICLAAASTRRQRVIANAVSPAR
jgi:hypothetical protein